MIEIRNDEIGDEPSQRRWADRLANILLGRTPGLLEPEQAVV
jgi:predicted N-formylglutamate amidohydrolase